MAKRISALVNANMSDEDAAAVIGCDPSALVQFGNGYAVVEIADEPTAPKAKKAKKIAKKEDVDNG